MIHSYQLLQSRATHMHRKTISLTSQQERWIKGQVESGSFGNDSEYIRDLIRQDQRAQERIAALREALLDGENSGTPGPLDIKSLKQRARGKAKIPR